MNHPTDQDFDFDVIVIGSGPAGQKAAVQAAKLQARVAMIEADRYLGGHCVHRGTIPSKTLRQNALRIADMRRHAHIFSYEQRADREMAVLVDNLDQVMRAHDNYIDRQMDRNHIERIHGRARFEDLHTLAVRKLDGSVECLRAAQFVIATGSYPRQLPNIAIDHEHIYDSDSVLSMDYLPQSMIVLGGGVIACEYASIFANLGVGVTMIDRYARPLGFLDSDMTDRFIHAFQMAGGQFVGDAELEHVYWDGVSQVVVELADGSSYRSDKLLAATGRVANVDGLQLEAIGLQVNERGLLSVDASCRTGVPNVFAAGDVIGPPSLASASMEQGRRAGASALGVELGQLAATSPVGIYAIPELSIVGLSARQARERFDEVIVGRAAFDEIARGQIAEIQDGLLELIADAEGRRLLGVEIVGEGATELIHIGQMALISEQPIDTFIETIFNFPTLAEAYRVAALDIVGQRNARRHGAGR